MKSKKIARLARAVGHPVRVGVLQLLGRGPALVRDLGEDLEVTPTVLSKHLAILRDAGLVECDAEWRCRRYRLVHPAEVEALLAALEGAAFALGGVTAETGEFA